MPDRTTHEILLEVEALLLFLAKSQAATDENSDVVVPALAAAAKSKVSEAIRSLPH